MRFGFLILTAVLLVGCRSEPDTIFENSSVENLEKKERSCQLSIMIFAVDVGTAHERAKELLEARDDCKSVLSDNKSFTLLAADHIIRKFESPKDVRLKDIFVRENSRAPYQKELAGKISVINEYGDFSKYRYFNIYVDNASFKWVVNFEDIRN